MAAKVYGDIIWDVEAEEGLYAQSFDMDYTVQELWVAGDTSNDVAGALFNESATWTLNGYTNTGGTAANTILGSVMTLANLFDPTKFIDGYTSGGLNILTGAKPARKKRDAEMMDLTGVFKPYMGALQGA